MGQYEEHQPREIELDNEDIQHWLSQNKPIVNHEVISAIEKYIYDNSDRPICALILKVSDPMYGDVMLQISIDGTDIPDAIKVINKWAIDTEEYELCQRIKNLNEYIEKNELQTTTDIDI